MVYSMAPARDDTLYGPNYISFHEVFMYDTYDTYDTFKAVPGNACR